MILTGKKINFLGDSITEGHGTSRPEACFVSLLKGQLHLAESRNYGVGGTRYARQTKPSAEPVWDQDFCSRVDRMDPDADIVVVFGGTNDYGHGDAPLGKVHDDTVCTFCGACRYVFSHLKKRYPEAAVVVLTPLPRLNEENPGGDAAYKPKPTAPLMQYVTALKDIAEEFHLPVLDLHETEDFHPEDPSEREKFMPDGLHPNDAGHLILAKRIGTFLQSL
jgi:lysophospholipase L1-like esterase